MRRQSLCGSKRVGHASVALHLGNGERFSLSIELGLFRPTDEVRQKELKLLVDLVHVVLRKMVESQGNVTRKL